MDDQKQNNEGIEGGLGALLSNPEAISKMAGALSRLGILDDGADTPSDESQEVSVPDSEKPPDPLSSLLSNPEILSKIPSVLSVLGELSGNTVPSPSLPDTKHGGDRRITLLLALRPYLSPRRREIVDYLIRMNKLGELFKKLQ